ncbi:Spc7 kinetochore protein-domain-containing protein [Kockovaella imperatae]|uniref:Spc7 kinetochore protein-domain-containing protein n=1 Tax=Kockovaella imperatae TaxID=4999 RepID=A0A1Y1UUJ1_9TREE|nr:Spc7 kinetochore protein-domain-containing protein [Kockovaella imperatae]ORX40865.1 Spc7 kinetochore protein-domain-containing protein [Kockovaella imperatae]
MSLAPSAPARSSPRRKSMGLTERKSNLDMDNLTLPVTFKDKAKKRAAFSMGGEGFKIDGKPRFEIGVVGEDGLTPKKRARRSLKPRKSILKGFNVNNDTSDDTVDFGTQNYAHTIAFSTSAASRRVSFAPSASVRMFEKDRENKSSTSGTDPTQPFPLPPKSATPRVSITAYGEATGPAGFSDPSYNRRVSVARFVDVGGEVDEISMDMASDDEGEDDDASGVQMGHPRASLGRAANAAVPTVTVSPDSGEEDEMDMEETQVIYGGIVQRQSASEQDDSFDTEVEKSIDEERTMDFTIAVGGMLPNSPPIHASQTRASMSIGYSVPMSPRSAGNRIHPGDPMPEEGDMSIEETVVIGGIIGADESISTASETSQTQQERTMTFSFGNLNTRPPASPGMEMTTVLGGIVDQSFSATQPRRSVSATEGQNQTSAGAAKAPTPSFARATVSSAKKTSPIKRNVFAPSPGPYPSTTPRKDGMATAADVAKRLSFSSTTSSAGKKRVREDDVDVPGSAKKSRPTPPTTPAEAVFGMGSTGPSRLSIGKPSKSLLPASPGPMPAPPTPQSYGRPRMSRQSLGTPSRMDRSGAGVTLQEPSTTPSKPYKSPRTLRQLRNEPVEDEVEDEQVVEGQEWDQPPAVSLSAFLEMAGIQFNDELPGIDMRRNSMRRSLAASSTLDRDYTLNEFAEARIHEAFYNAYNWACSKLRTDISARHEELLDRERECAEDAPTVIKEYLAASDEDKALFESTFKDFKLNTLLKAQLAWYEWKTGLMTALKPHMQEYLDGQKEDQGRLVEMEEQATTLLPQLQDRVKALEAELAREKTTIAEIAECDPGELQDLHMAMDEQAEQLKDFQKEYDDAKTKLDGLATKLGELNSKKKDCETAISIAASKCDHYTKSDVLRLKDEYASLQHLHLWQVELASPTSLVLAFDDEVRVDLTCTDYVPDIASANVDLLDKPGKRGSRYSQDSTDAIFALFGEAMRMLMGMGYTSLSPFIQRIGQLWTSCQRLRSELGLLAFRHPITFRVGEGSIIVSAMMMIPSFKSKSLLHFHLEPDLLYDWPIGLGNVQVTSSIVYGSADGEVLSQAASNSMRSATSSMYIGSFLQACVEASAQV